MTMTIIALFLAGQAAAIPAATVVRDKPHLICRESEHETGSHIRTGTRCKTADEWRQDDERRAQIPTSLRVTAGQGDALTKQPAH